VTNSWEEKNDKALQKDITRGSGNFPSLNYLKLTKRQQVAMTPLEVALDNKTPNCKNNPGEYIDYHEDYEPTAQRAYEMCGGCPMLVECARFANAYRPPIGVWGGQVWREGKVVPSDYSNNEQG
jgi:Transcription factor WhiB